MVSSDVVVVDAVEDPRCSCCSGGKKKEEDEARKGEQRWPERAPES